MLFYVPQNIWAKIGMLAFAQLVIVSINPAFAQDVFVAPNTKTTDATAAQQEVLSSALNPKPTIAVVAPDADVASLPMYQKRLEYRELPQKLIEPEATVVAQDIIVDGFPFPLQASGLTTEQENRELAAHVAVYVQLKQKLKNKDDLLEGFRSFVKYHQNSRWNTSVLKNLESLKN